MKNNGEKAFSKQFTYIIFKLQIFEACLCNQNYKREESRTKNTQMFYSQWNIIHRTNIERTIILG